MNLDSSVGTGTSSRHFIDTETEQETWQNAGRLGKSVTGQQHENQQLLCLLVGHEVEGGMCTLYRNSRRLCVSIWKREKTKPVIHSFWFIFQQSLKNTHRGWVLAAQGTPVRSWRLSGAKTTPGNKPGEDKHEGTDAVLPWWGHQQGWWQGQDPWNQQTSLSLEWKAGGRSSSPGLLQTD